MISRLISNEVFLSVFKVIEQNRPICVFSLFVHFSSFWTDFFVFLSDNFMFDKLKSVAYNALNHQNIYIKSNNCYIAEIFKIVNYTRHYFCLINIMTLVGHICRHYVDRLKVFFKIR